MKPPPNDVKKHRWIEISQQSNTKAKSSTVCLLRSILAEEDFWLRKNTNIRNAERCVGLEPTRS
jgi:hypothetical protein